MEKDERIILPDRGIGRDIGRNPAFDGAVPHTRQDAREGVAFGSVGGWGERNDAVRSMAATAVAIGMFAESTQDNFYRVVEGAGALRGWSLILSDPPASGTVTLRANNQNGPIIARFSLDDYPAFATQYLGDFGINFDTLWLQVSLDAAQVVSGAIWVASVE